jgi:glycerol-3-phosphate acyltransferase PlsY
MEANLILVSLLSYILGSIPFSYLVAKLYGKNLYQVGSGNIGTANVWRATNRVEALALAFFGDFGKGILALILSKKILSQNLFLAQSLAAFFAILGHDFPIFLKFKGGRGLATLMGVLIYLNWKTIPIALLTVAFFIFLTEILMKKGINLGGRAKEKIKKLFNIFISQVLGRMIGIIFSAILIFVLFPETAKIIFPAAILIFAKHIKRTKSFLEKKHEI